VSWSNLNEILISRGCPDGARNIILSLTCKPALLNLSVNQSERVAIQTKKGVFQGGGISAFVFALYIDPLAMALNGSVPTYKPAALLYADDIKLNPSSPAEAQRLLDVCQSYATKLKFEWNIKKCAVVARSPITLHLAFEEIPNSETYKYLGAVHRWNRVDWESTILKATEKQSKFLASLDSASWHPRLKLILYRTFVRPINEYILPLAYLWIKRQQSTRQNSLKLLKQSYKDGICFIFGRKQHLELMDFMCGFGSFEYRMECLLAGLNASFNRLKSSNPLLLARSVYCVSSSSHYILHSCFNSSYLAEYSIIKTNQLTITWPSWKRQKLEQIRQSKAKSAALVSYYCPQKRLSDNSSPAFVLPLASFKTVTDWRLNRFLNHRTCRCGHQFNRSHISCYLPGLNLYDTHLSSTGFQRSVRHLSAMGSNIKNYGVFDFILNSSGFSDFLFLFSELQRLVDC
jgi:hypothetical protein